ncbi:hypothetical protein [Variovorax sp. PBL-H6]|uniref:hypothetical protein n=1 Tax=Variovorax sp. PBL-H6 TaxID=434009 RepID=UPI0013A5A62F|nr:hypothetical protein [Variovorax sp. PBL-H6]
MTRAKLRITGPHSSSYVLGEPMYLYDGPLHVATLDPVPVNREGTEVHIEHFSPSPTVTQQKLEISKLALVEMVYFIAENFTSVQAISLSLSRQVEGYGDGMRLAGARSSFLQSLGASHIVIAPKPNAEHMGHFIVSGLWEYNPANLEALVSVLQHERETYYGRPAAAEDARRPGLGAWVRRFIPGAAPRAGNGSDTRENEG